MHIVCWNVAGWKTTVENIAEHHKDGSNNGTSAGSSAALENWLKLMEVDILCLQEVKLMRSKVAENAVPLGMRSANYDVFMSLPAGGDSSSSSSGKTSRQQSGGLNGVATYVKKGLASRACSTALDGGGELDKEGRCIMTDHGSFVVFNVYVPNGQGGQRMPLKQSFLRALETAMEKERRRGAKVILCGDLNIHYRAQDCFKYWRRIDINAMLYQRNLYHSKTTAFDVGTLEQAKKGEVFERKLGAFLQYLAGEWRPIEAALLNTTKVVREGWDSDSGATISGSSSSGGGGGKGAKSEAKVKVPVKLKVTHPHTGKEVELKTKLVAMTENKAKADGGLESGTADTVSRMKWDFNLGGRYVDNEGNTISSEDYNRGVVSGQPVLLVKREGCLDVEDLRKAIGLLASKFFDPDTGEVVGACPYSRAQGKGSRESYDAKMEPYWEAIASTYGDVCASPCDARWMQELLGLSRSQEQGAKEEQKKDKGEGEEGRAVMVDPFALARTRCRDRFTIWSQYQNERYRNEGTRIDFTLCDKELWEQHGRVGGPLDGYVHPRAAASADADVSAVAGVGLSAQGESTASSNAAVNFNAFQPAPFGGGGMPRASEEAYQVHLRGHLKGASGLLGGKGNLHTGIIYTPPEYSDHVGVSLLLDDSIKAGMSLPLALKEDKETKATQPHQAQKTMLSFFGAAAAKPASSGAGAGSAKRPFSATATSSSSTKSKGTIAGFFDKRSKKD
jgi:exodeoxyribonuclease III